MACLRLRRRLSIDAMHSRYILRSISDGLERIELYVKNNDKTCNKIYVRNVDHRNAKLRYVAHLIDANELLDT